MIKILIIGHARHGKDTIADYFNEFYDCKCESSSIAALRLFLYDALKGKYDYKTPEECFEDRVNHRAEWHKLICDYNKNDKAKLAKDILNISNCYVGMRDTEEINECIKQGLFDLIIWVDASKRLPMEDSSSFNIDQSCADIIIENNYDYESFKSKVIRLGKIIFKK